MSYLFADGFLNQLAEFDAANDNYEDFEEEWDSNENGKFAFDLSATPTDLDQALFDTADDKFEDFESEWTLTL